MQEYECDLASRKNGIGMKKIIVLGLIAASCASQNKSVNTDNATTDASCVISISGEGYVNRSDINELTISLGNCKQCITTGFEYAVNDSLLFEPIKMQYSGKPVTIKIEQKFPGKHGVYVRAKCISEDVKAFYYNVGAN